MTIGRRRCHPKTVEDIDRWLDELEQDQERELITSLLDAPRLGGTVPDDDEMEALLALNREAWVQARADTRRVLLQLIGPGQPDDLDARTSHWRLADAEAERVAAAAHSPVGCREPEVVDRPAAGTAARAEVSTAEPACPRRDCVIAIPACAGEEEVR